MESPKTPESYVEGIAGDVIKPYLSGDGKTFARDFYVQNRLAAMAGASVDDYRQALMFMGLGGWADEDPGLARPDRHSFVVAPRTSSDQQVTELITSPGTIGWNPLGATYMYDPLQEDWVNLWAWYQSGRPKRNQFGEWANDGLPLGYVQETWKGVNERNLRQPGFPGSIRRGNHRR